MNPDRFHPATVCVSQHCACTGSYYSWKLACLCRDGKVRLEFLFSVSKHLQPSNTPAFSQWDSALERINGIVVLDSNRFKREGLFLCASQFQPGNSWLSSHATILPIESHTFRETKHTFWFAGKLCCYFRQQKTQKIHSDTVNNGFRQTKGEQGNSSILRMAKVSSGQKREVWKVGICDLRNSAFTGEREWEEERGRRFFFFFSVKGKKCVMPGLFYQCVMNAQQAKSSFVT